MSSHQQAEMACSVQTSISSNAMLFTERNVPDPSSDTWSTNIRRWWWNGIHGEELESCRTITVDTVFTVNFPGTIQLLTIDGWSFFRFCPPHLLFVIWKSSTRAEPSWTAPDGKSWSRPNWLHWTSLSFIYLSIFSTMQTHWKLVRIIIWSHFAHPSGRQKGNGQLFSTLFSRLE